MEDVEMEGTHCASCGQPMQADANFCTRCGKPKESSIGEVPSTSDREVKSRVGSDALRAEGITGQIEVSSGIITITRKGLKATLSQGSKGEMTIPASQVTRVDYKKPTLVVNGHIHMIVVGETEHGHLNCPRTVTFRGREQEDAFEKIAALVNKMKDEIAVQKQETQASVTHQDPAVGQSGEANRDAQDASAARCPYCGVPLDPAPRRKRRCASCGNDIYVRRDPRSQHTVLLRQEEAERLDALKREEAWRVERTRLRAELRRCARDGVTHVQIITSRDDRVCGKCRNLDGTVFTIQEAMEEMPLPVKCDDEESWCRCVYTYEMRRT
jgi:hypothetical protein